RPGRHLISVARPGYAQSSHTLEAAWGEEARFDADLQPDAESLARYEAERERRADEAAVEGAEPGWTSRWTLWAGVGGAVLVTAIVIVVVASSASQDTPREGFELPSIQPGVIP
ncbi:MAG: hypothetical protein OEY14_13975, partial [Myxococcales bacterium]|nr:hypothetical protein [Myxococcales bacterium]